MLNSKERRRIYLTPVSLQLFDLSQSHQHLPVKNNMRLQPKPVFNSPSDRTFAFHRALVIKKKSLIQKLKFLPTVEVRSRGLRSLSTFPPGMNAVTRPCVPSSAELSGCVCLPSNHLAVSTPKVQPVKPAGGVCGSRQARRRWHHL